MLLGTGRKGLLGKVATKRVRRQKTPESQLSCIHFAHACLLWSEEQSIHVGHLHTIVVKQQYLGTQGMSGTLLVTSNECSTIAMPGYTGQGTWHTRHTHRI